MLRKMYGLRWPPRYVLASILCSCGGALFGYVLLLFIDCIFISHYWIQMN